jgi:hypothetical protein
VKITKDTDPKTLMFEGYPEIEIVALSDKYPRSDNDIYVFVKREGLKFHPMWDGGSALTAVTVSSRTHSSYRYNADGTKFHPYVGLPDLVRRSVEIIDPNKPILASGTTPYEFLGWFMPHDGGQRMLVLLRQAPGERNEPLMVDPTTGCVATNMRRGVSLTFRNAPVIEGYNAFVTEVDGVVTKIERI